MKLRGKTTGERPPFVSDVTALASNYPQLALNAEIKELVPCAQRQAQVRQFQQEMGHGNSFMTSGLAGNLRCARQADGAG